MRRLGRAHARTQRAVRVLRVADHEPEGDNCRERLLFFSPLSRPA